MKTRLALSAIFQVYKQNPNITYDVAAANTTGCMHIDTRTAYGDEGLMFTFKLKPQEVACYYIQTALVLGSDMELTAHFYDNDTRKYVSDGVYKNFVGVSTQGYVMKNERTLGPIVPTIIQIKNTLKTDNEFYIILALASTKIDDLGDQRSYYNTLSSFTWKVVNHNKELLKFTKVMNLFFGTKAELKFWSNTGSFNVEENEEYYDSSENRKLLEASNDTKSADEIAKEFGFITDESGQIEFNKSAEAYVYDPRNDSDVSAWIKWNLKDQPKKIPRFFGAFRDSNTVYTAMTVSGPGNLPIWSIILMMVIFFLLFITIVIGLICWCCCCCKKCKKKKRSSSSSSSPSTAVYSTSW